MTKGILPSLAPEDPEEELAKKHQKDKDSSSAESMSYEERFKGIMLVRTRIFSLESIAAFLSDFMIH